MEPPAIAASRRRRTPGWRREEVAEACGVSVTWITWLEQGRECSASARSLARLADVLRLSPAERAYLFELADRKDPTARPAPEADLPRSLLALPASFTGPAYILDRTWTARAWNQSASGLFRGWLDRTHDRNLLRFVFLSAASRRLIADWNDRARRLVAEFRVDFSRHLREPAMQALVEDLLGRSDAFRHIWQAQSVLDREGGERRFNRPTRRFHQTTLIPAAHPEAKLVVLLPIDS